jgi:hypothetical protein
MVAVAMLVVLAVTIAGAWWLVWARNAPARRGAELIDQVQAEGLDAFWQGPEVQFWQIQQTQLTRYGPARNVLWTVELRKRRADGGFEELSVTGANPERLQWAYWKLDANATNGLYQAGILARNRANRRLETRQTTEIRQTGDKLAVEQFMDEAGKRVETFAPVPENYAPEGTLRLLRALTARNGEHADFLVVYDQVPPGGQEPTFNTVQYEYRGETTFENRQVHQLRTHQTSRDDEGNQFTTRTEYLIDPELGEIQRESVKRHHSGQVVTETRSRLVPDTVALTNPIARAIFQRALGLAKAREMENLNVFQPEATDTQDPPAPPEPETDDR